MISVPSGTWHNALPKTSAPMIFFWPPNGAGQIISNIYITADRLASSAILLRYERHWMKFNATAAKPSP